MAARPVLDPLLVALIELAIAAAPQVFFAVVAVAMAAAPDGC